MATEENKDVVRRFVSECVNVHREDLLATVVMPPLLLATVLWPPVRFLRRKGVPAALVMATTRTLLRTTAEQLVAPGAVLWPEEGKAEHEKAAMLATRALNQHRDFWRGTVIFSSVVDEEAYSLGAHTLIDSGLQALAVAASIGSIPWEVLCRLGSRIERIYSVRAAAASEPF